MMGTRVRRTKKLTPPNNRFEGTPLAAMKAVIDRGFLGPQIRFDLGNFPWSPTRLSVDANRLGLRTPDLPPWITPEQAVEMVRQWAQAEYDRVGDATRAAIREALTDSGIPHPDRWMYSVAGHAKDNGRDMLTILRFMPHPAWPLPHDVVGNVVASGIRVPIPDPPSSVSFKGGDYKDYIFDMFGPVFHAQKELEKLPTCVAQDVIEMKDTRDRRYWAVKYRVRAFHAHSAAVGVALWRPGQSAISTEFRGGTLSGPDESHIARRGLELFYAIQHHAGGRPAESFKGQAWTRGEILQWYEEASQMYASEGSKITLSDLGDAMGVSDETAGKRVRKAELSWPPTPEQLEEVYAAN